MTSTETVPVFEDFEPPFRIGTGYLVPVGSAGVAHWAVLDANGEPVCAVTFEQMNPDHPAFKDYMEAQRVRVQSVCDALNLSIEAKVLFADTINNAE